MSDLNVTLSRIQSLQSELQQAVLDLKLESPQKTEKALERVKNSIRSLEEVIDYNKVLRDAILAVVDESQSARYQLVQQALTAPLSEVDKLRLSSARKAIESNENALLEQARIISLEIINQSLQDIQESGKRILTATTKVKDAIARLENVNKQIQALAKLVNLFQTIINAAAQGIPALIGTVLDEIDAL